MKNETTVKNIKSTTEKNITQIEESIEAKKTEAKALEKEAARLKQIAEYEKGAQKLRDVYNAFIGAGFTEAQTWEFIMTTIKGNGSVRIGF